MGSVPFFTALHAVTICAGDAAGQGQQVALAIQALRYLSDIRHIDRRHETRLRCARRCSRPMQETAMAEVRTWATPKSATPGMKCVWLGRLRNYREITSRFHFPPHLDPLPRYALRGGGEETVVEVISETFLSYDVLPERGMKVPTSPTRQFVGKRPGDLGDTIVIYSSSDLNRNFFVFAARKLNKYTVNRRKLNRINEGNCLNFISCLPLHPRRSNA